MLLSVIYALLCGKHHPASVAGWVEAHYADWLRDALGFPQPERPCRTTYYLFMRGLDWQALETALSGWIRGMALAYGLDVDPEALALDGKEVRGMRRMSGEALVLVSAFTHQSGLTLALRSFPEGQEQAAVQALLQELTLNGRVITADALHTQRDTSQLILDQEGEYVLTVKGNQETLRTEIQACLEPWRAADQERRLVSTAEKGHGRRETRTLVAVSVQPGEVDWPGVAQVFCLTRQVSRKGKHTFEVVYGITSLNREEADAARLLQLNRGHWGIENRSHWVRDVVCREDAGLAFRDNTAEVLAVVRATVLNLFRIKGVKNIAAQFRRNVDQPREAARFLGLPVPSGVL
jgi:predicted transposase YbfD/YdcC